MYQAQLTRLVAPHRTARGVEADGNQHGQQLLTARLRQRLTSVDPANGTTNNAMVLGLQNIYATANYGFTSAATMVKALHERDHYNPVVTGLSQNAPSAWVDAVPLSATATGSDRGMGMFEFAWIQPDRSQKTSTRTDCTGRMGRGARQAGRPPSTTTPGRFTRVKHVRGGRPRCRQQHRRDAVTAVDHQSPHWSPPAQPLGYTRRHREHRRDAQRRRPIPRQARRASA